MGIFEKFCTYRETVNEYGSTGGAEWIAHVLNAKKWFVEMVEFDQGPRKRLNIGYTFGHVRKSATELAIQHGIAINVGVLAALTPPLSHQGVLEARLAGKCLSLLAPVSKGFRSVIESFSVKKLEEAFLGGKKRSSQELQLILSRQGTLRVIDEKTIYLRMPSSYLESDTCLIVLRNLMSAAHDRQTRIEPVVATPMTLPPTDAAPPETIRPVSPPKKSVLASAAPTTAPSKPTMVKPAFSPLDRPPRELTPAERSKQAIEDRVARSKLTAAAKVPPAPQKGQKPVALPTASAPGGKPAAMPGKLSPEMEKLTSLVAMGILTEEEFQSAIKRLAAKGGQ